MAIWDRTKAFLVLENGLVFSGFSFGSTKKGLGEVCFNTSMSGYQEILTDPSYMGQLVCLSYPMIGNYGISGADNESSGIQAAGLIVKEYVDFPSAYHSEGNLGDFLESEGKPGIEGIDTRKLVLALRKEGAMRGGIFVAESYTKEMLEEVRGIPPMQGRDLASEAGTKSRYRFNKKRKDYLPSDLAALKHPSTPRPRPEKTFRLAVLDFGIKTNILQLLYEAGFGIEVFGPKTPFSELKDGNFDAYFLSNGPGDPEPLDYAIDTIRQILEEGKPVFGICLGHQLLGLARGQKSFKLKFGHRGANQPVLDFRSRRVEITSQNHGFAIEADAIPSQMSGAVPNSQGTHKSGLHISHLNLNDKTIEGFRDPATNLMSVQHHPEASPGPHDSAYLFQEFYELVDRHKAPEKSGIQQKIS